MLKQSTCLHCVERWQLHCFNTVYSNDLQRCDINLGLEVINRQPSMLQVLWKEKQFFWLSHAHIQSNLVRAINVGYVYDYQCPITSGRHNQLGPDVTQWEYGRVKFIQFFFNTVSYPLNDVSEWTVNPIMIVQTLRSLSRSQLVLELNWRLQTIRSTRWEKACESNLKFGYFDRKI